MTKTLTILGCLIALATGCGSQVGDDYDGDAQAKVQGELTLTSDAVPSGPLSVAVVWYNTDASPDSVVGQKVNVEGQFPLGFEFDLVEPPPTSVLTDFTGQGTLKDETRIGLGFIIAYPPSAEGVVLRGEEPTPGTVFGGATRFLVAYVENDIVDGTRSAALVGGPLKKGFHLLRSTPSSASSETIAAYVDRCEAGNECSAELDAVKEAKDASGKYTAEFRAFLLCEEAADKANGCIDERDPSFDTLNLAPNGFSTTIEVEIGNEKLELPNWT